MRGEGGGGGGETLGGGGGGGLPFTAGGAVGRGLIYQQNSSNCRGVTSKKCTVKF